MTVEELLRQRYEVISPYPEIERHNIKVGDIITRMENRMQADYLQDGTPVVAIDHELFPAIFKKLDWREKRRKEDMPTYIKTPNGKVYEVYSVEYWNMPAGDFRDCLPATEDEFKNQP